MSSTETYESSLATRFDAGMLSVVGARVQTREERRGERLALDALQQPVSTPRIVRGSVDSVQRSRTLVRQTAATAA